MNIFKKVFRKIEYLLRISNVIKNKNALYAAERLTQISLMNQYKIMAGLGTASLPQNFLDTGFKVYSQLNEDGILLYIFSLIGFTNRKVVEVCAGTGEESNTANLIINHACSGLLFDGSKKNMDYAKKFFEHRKPPAAFSPKCVCAWITKDNINHLIEENGFSGDIDLLSLDLDGNDYWIWEALTVVTPRVFICEVQNICPDDKAVTIPYQEDFSYTSEKNYHREFRSASPLAMLQLSKKKGYRLIGAHSHGFNLIFMRNGTGENFFREVSLESALNDPFTVESKKTRWPAVKDAPWVNVKESLE